MIGAFGARIGFYRADRPYGEFSSLWPAEIEFEDQVFRDAEHAYQWGKFSDKSVADIAMRLPGAYLAVLAHGLLPWQVTPGWSRELKVPRMLAVQRAKYQQNLHLAVKLLGTEEAELVEESGDDTAGRFWGAGKNGKGKNVLGLILMVIRAEERDRRGRGPAAPVERDAAAKLRNICDLVHFDGSLALETAGVSA